MAEDVFQQTWLRVAERIGRYDRRRPFAPWLLAVGRNLALDQLRKLKPESLEDEDEVANPVAGPGVPANPLDSLAAAERRERVERALGDLGARDREILHLRFDADLSLKEMSTFVDAPLPTVKARLYRALRRLRQHLLDIGPREDWTS